MTKEELKQHIGELEKENAELKKKVENLQKYLDTRKQIFVIWSAYPFTLIKRLQTQNNS